MFVFDEEIRYDIFQYFLLFFNKKNRRVDSNPLCDTNFIQIYFKLY